jgi:tRNA/rRNA methyltransferase
LDSIRIVIVEPAGALNVGSIARVMKNMGLQQLVIVNPRCEVFGEEATRMAVHAIDLLQAARIVPDLTTALEGCTRVIATTARDSDLPSPPETPRQALPWLFDNDRSTALIFGREDNGLNNAELNYAQRHIRIPVGSDYSSLNLAQAVAVCAYELQMCVNDAELSPIPAQPDLAPFDQIEGYYQQLETLLLDIEYLLPHTAPHRMEKIRRMYNRARLSPNDVALLRGILSQFRGALSRAATGSRE